ncbi:MAG TPA: DUF1028 domain-containing protein [Sphingomicrobium sp.]
MTWLAAATALVASPATATWTIVAVDQRTGEVGSAGASCTPFVAGVAQLVPGRGAVVAQAMSNMEAKAAAAELIARRRSAQAVVRAISDKTFDADADLQQYGVAVLGSRKPSAAAFTGNKTPKARGHLVADGVAVQGNILVSEGVLRASFTAYQKAKRDNLPLADRLMVALEAGSRAGGDARCGAKTAQSAYLGVARRSDAWNRPSLRIVVSTERERPDNPVAAVRREYEAQLRNKKR